MVGMLVAGFGLIFSGLLAIGYGVQYKEFSVGSTLILAGVIAVCTGLILLGLWAAVREFKLLARRLGSGPAANARPAFPLESADFAAPTGEPGSSSHRDQPVFDPGGSAPAMTARGASPPPWHQESASRTRSEPPSVAPDAEPTEPETAPRRRNLLFSSTSRRDRERPQARAGEPLPPDLSTPDLRSNPKVEAAPQIDKEPPATFDDAWPRPERARPADAPPRRPAAAPSAGESTRIPSADRRPPALQEQPPVTVLKSGVVDGMAYTLYSDGSIEAQMPEGMMRFASIDELRTHLDQRS